MADLDGRYQRTQVYDAVDYQRPKYLFEVVGNHLANLLQDREAPAVIDIGGASGALAHYLKQRFSHAALTSVDFDAELCRIGAEQIADVEFIVGDANDLHQFADSQFDAVTMTGTLGVFDDFEPSLGECLRIGRPGGRIIVVGQFNDHPVDAIVRYRYSGKDDWNTGYNLFSVQSVSRFLDRHEKAESYRFEPFELPFDLAPQDDPIRSWTRHTTDGRREFVNGLNLIINLKILTIEVA